MKYLKITLRNKILISDVQVSFIIFATNKFSEKMAKKTKNWGGKILFFILGMLVMLALDMIFQFNNSVEKGISRELNKAQQKIEDALK
jgi:cell division protein ZapA (FtsZ GTPase activity inhibitor)